MAIHFALNDTSTHPDGSLIEGGQLHRYFQPVWDALDELGAEFTVGRQPANDAINVYPNGRGTYQSGSSQLDRLGVGVSHGLASKRYRQTQYRFLRHIFAPGPAFRDEMEAERIPPQRIEVNGYPKLDPIHNGEVERSPKWSDDDRVKVLYAPTHGGGSERQNEGNQRAPGAGATSWWHRDLLLEQLVEAGFEVVLAPHPRHSDGHQATFDEYVGADVVIADGGSTIYEAWCLGLPVVLPAWLTRHRNELRAGGHLLEARVYRERLGYQADHPDHLPELVRQAAEQGLDDRARAFAERIIPTDMRGRGGRLWAQRLVELDEMTPSRRAGRTQRARTPTPPRTRTFRKGGFVRG